ncbi:MAG: hypothetical protein JJU11_15420 [Candidatus Sumerlaeia bacterium]|nr:hypothetical protein [Candidatus Sumerlaeia bacterium]
MRKTFIAGISAVALTMSMGFSNEAKGLQIIPTQDFDGFTVNESLIGQGLWLERGENVTGPELLVGPGPLVYAAGGLPTAEGNHIILTGENGEDARIPFDFDDPEIADALTPADNNTYYWSAVISYDGTNYADGESYVGAFLATDLPGSTTGRGVMNIRGEMGEVQLGVRLGTVSVTPPIFDINNPLTPNEPVFAVIKVTEVPGERNDTAELFLFQNTAVPETEPATANAISENDTNFTGVSPDVQAGNGMRQITFRQFSAPFPGNILVDQIRVGTTWESIISDPEDEDPGDPGDPTSVDNWLMFH